jgi:hypothetical protein
MTTRIITRKEFHKQDEINRKKEEQYEYEAFDIIHRKEELTVNLYCDNCKNYIIHILYARNLRCSKCKGFGYWLTISNIVIKSSIKNNTCYDEVVSIPQNVLEILIKNHELMNNTPRFVTSDGNISIYAKFPKLYHSCGRLK